jgi:alginate O-acetyltransferase complex protein AlgI
MSYHSLQFILFFALFLSLYFLFRNYRIRQCILLGANLLFYYAAGGGNALLILLVTYVLLAVCARGISCGRASGGYLAAGILLCLGILVYIKAGLRPGMKEVKQLSALRLFRTFLIPLGISYYTLSSIGFLLDLYHHKAHFQGEYPELLLSMTFFPQIVEGPVSRYDRLIRQFRDLPPFSADRLVRGLQRMLWGYLKKLVLADRIAVFTAALLKSSGEHAGSLLLLAVLLGAVQLYADFSGCMDIVIGAAETMGITLDENFRQPFFADSIADFWRRWHCTLLTWFRDYVYLPLAVSPLLIQVTRHIRHRFGRKAGKGFSYALPVCFVWALTGLWHAFSGCYLLWGAYWAVIILSGSYLQPLLHHLCNRYPKYDLQMKTAGGRLLRAVRIFLLFCIGRSFTVTGSLAGFRMLYHQIFHHFDLWEIFAGRLYTHGLDERDFQIVLFGILLLTVVDYLQHKGIVLRKAFANQPLIVRWLFWYGSIAAIVLLGMYGSGYDPTGFLYAGF